jgi:RES domain-containing protein
MLAPKWAHAPLSGDGAAARGGRYNERGTPALYMSEEFVTAVAEYELDLGIRPGTLCAYDVDVRDIADLCDSAVRADLGIVGDELYCPWRDILLVQKARPPTWDVAARLIAAGAAGARVPSTRTANGVNLVLWRWNDTKRHSVVALDPLGDLPRDSSSWHCDDLWEDLNRRDRRDIARAAARHLDIV